MKRTVSDFIPSYFKDFFGTKTRLNSPDGFGDRLLHRACYKDDPGRVERVRLLLEKGADVNVTNIVGTTPLHVACERGHTEIVQMFLSHGADARAIDRHGRTPLDLAIALKDQPEREEIIDLFRQYAPEQVMEAYCTSGPGG